MKVICIRNDYGGQVVDNNLTIGKEYECTGEFFTNSYCIIIGGEFELWYCPKDFFITKEEYRNKKLEEIGI